jgi:hypothetical protein
MDSCTEKNAFLNQKMANFKNYISKYNPDNEVSEQMNTLTISDLGAFVLPMRLLGSSKAISHLISHLKIPASELDAVTAKLTAYFDMFLEIM